MPSRLAGAAAGAALLAALAASPAWAQPTAAADAPVVVTPPDATVTPVPATPPGLERPALPPSGAASVAPLPATVPFAAPDALAAPPAAELVLDHPRAIDTGRLAGDGRAVTLFGIIGVEAMASGLQDYIKGQGDRVSCQPHGPDDFTCLLPDGTDVALVALANGAARAAADAPASYLAQEASAQAVRRGIWSNLPPPPVTVSHPTARTSAILVSGDGAYVLYGLEGLAGPPASTLQAYIAAHGDALLCQPQGGPRRYLCTLPDGTDIAKVALVNGAARVAPDAPDAYRVQQAEAQQNHRGIWAASAPAVAAPAPAYGAPAYGIAPPAYVPPPAYEVAPEDAQGPVTYLGDQPTALIDGETVFLAYGAGLGWGYYDHFHRWHGAPERFARHLDRFHPEGRGLHGEGGRGAEFGAGRVGREGSPGFHAGFDRPPGFREGHSGFGEGRPGFGEGRPGFVGEGRPGIRAGQPVPAWRAVHLPGRAATSAWWPSRRGRSGLCTSLSVRWAARGGAALCPCARLRGSAARGARSGLHGRAACLRASRPHAGFRAPCHATDGSGGAAPRGAGASGLLWQAVLRRACRRGRAAWRRLLDG